MHIAWSINFSKPSAAHFLIQDRYESARDRHNKNADSDGDGDATANDGASNSSTGAGGSKSAIHDRLFR